MPDSMTEQLRRDMACEDLLECFHGVTPLDRAVFGVVAGSETPLTVDQIAEAVDRERSTAYRSVQRLLDAGFVRKRQINYENGGYYHVFEQVAADEIADDLQRLLNDWYATVDRLIDDYREKYDEATITAASIEG